MQYLIPVAKGLLNSPNDPLNYVFRIILPCLFVLLAAIATRFAHGSVAAETEQSAGFDVGGLEGGMPMPAGVTKIMVNPLAHP